MFSVQQLVWWRVYHVATLQWRRIIFDDFWKLAYFTMVGRVWVQNISKILCNSNDCRKWFQIVFSMNFTFCSFVVWSVFLTSIKWINRWSKINVLCCRKVIDQFSHKQKPAEAYVLSCSVSSYIWAFQELQVDYVCIRYRYTATALDVVFNLLWLWSLVGFGTCQINVVGLLVESRCIIHNVQ